MLLYKLTLSKLSNSRKICNQMEYEHLFDFLGVTELNNTILTQVYDIANLITRRFKKRQYAFAAESSESSVGGNRCHGLQSD